MAERSVRSPEPGSLPAARGIRMPAAFEGGRWRGGERAAAVRGVGVRELLLWLLLLLAFLHSFLLRLVRAVFKCLLCVISNSHPQYECST